MQRYPLVLGPVSAQSAFEVGHDLAGPEAARAFIHSVTLSEICNLPVLPNVALPVGVADGLPQGVQLIAGRFHEDLCFDAAEGIESRVGVFPRSIRAGMERRQCPEPRGAANSFFEGPRANLRFSSSFRVPAEAACCVNGAASARSGAGRPNAASSRSRTAPPRRPRAEPGSSFLR